MKRNKVKRSIWVGFLMLCLLLPVAGCGNSETQDIVIDDEESDKIRIGMLFDTFVVERWQRDRDVFVSTAKELGAEVDIQNANGDSQIQISQMQYFIDMKVDAIVVVPIDAASLSGLVKKAKEEGIKVISYDRLATGANVDLYISFDNMAVGRLMGESLNETLSAGDQVLMMSGPSTDNNVNYVNLGFQQEMENNGIEVLDLYYTEGWRAENAEEYIRQNYDKAAQVKAIMCGNDNIAGRVILALSEQRLAGTVYVVGQDADLEACQRIVEGTQYMTVYKPVEKLATEAAEITVKMAKGEPLKTTGTISDGNNLIPYIKLEPFAVTADNMDEIIVGSGFHLKEDIYLNKPEVLETE